MPALACALLCSCGRYADFTLPPFPPGAAPRQFQWQPDRSPVLRRGAAGEWDSQDVLNPSVIVRDGLYYNFYSGFDGRTWHTGFATSTDGVTWRKQGKVLSPDPATWEGSYIAANGAALFDNGQFLYWYQAGPKGSPRIALAGSQDGHSWRKTAAPVLETGPRGSWDERAVADPFVIRSSAYFYLYYLGQDRARRQRLGLARSKDGVTWEKLRTNPVLELGPPGAFDEEGLGEPAVWGSRGSYWMLYTGRDRKEYRRLGLARSPDGVHWERTPLVVAGAADWNAKVVCDPSIEVRPNDVRVWFGGGDVASPDENLHGEIGMGTLK